ncbi:MAG: hypothetical protein AAF500_10545 [Myxococcota bacterium]
MVRLACFSLGLIVAAGCVLEDQPVDPDGGVAGSAGSPATGGVGGGIPCGPCSGDTPVCNDATGACVECTDADTSACTAPTPACDATTFTCVACLTSQDCQQADAARCDPVTLECVGCETANDCSDIPGAPACGDGVCVECTPASESVDCPGTSCNPATFRCTATPIGSRATCETCQSDTECSDDADRCVAMNYQGEAFPDEETGFCLRQRSASCERPFSITLEDRSSFSGPPTEDYCGINEELATCPAVLALLADDRCAQDEDCPQPSGLCRDVGGLPDRCTYACSTVVECLDDLPPGRPGATCGPPAPMGASYCGGPD